MKSKITLCLALILGVGWFGCSTAEHRSANSKPPRPDLYLHLIAYYEYPEPTRLILSAPIHRSTDFNFLTDDQQQLTGRVERRNGKYFVHFQVYLYSGMHVFDGEVELDKPEDPYLEPYNDKVPFVYQPMFVLSRNSSPTPFLKQQAAVSLKAWHRKNPLTLPQIAEVKRKFCLLRPGMTEDEVFTMFGLSGYHRRLHRSNFFFGSSDWSIGNYQLADKERLLLFFDDTGVKTFEESFGVNGAFGNRLVIRAELDTVVSFSNSPSMWQSALEWP